MPVSFFTNEDKKTSKHVAQCLRLSHLEFKQIFLQLNHVFNIGYSVVPDSNLKEIIYSFNQRQLAYLKKIFNQFNKHAKTL